MKRLITISILAMQVGAYAQLNQDPPRAKTSNGIVEGTSHSGISIFKGIPFAQPPVGELRWKAPQPMKNWEGVRQADQFGPRPMQSRPYSDMNFRSPGHSEDCLYLNVWTPARSAGKKFPVLVYFYGGGYMAGDGSEPRYDGENMARKGIVSLTVNYRLGVFGFLAHPELSKETSYHGSGNYGLMDQWAALRWVKENIAAFGGDPKRVTIAGESAGSMSVSAQMASPLSRELIAGAIGESGAIIKPTLAPVSLAEGEKTGMEFAARVGAKSLAELRAMSGETLLKASSQRGLTRFHATVDGYFFPKLPVDIYMAGEQAHVPLLVGWNSQETHGQELLTNGPPTAENYTKILQALYGDKAAEALKLYPASTPEEVIVSATALAGDRFIGYGTWKWYDSHLKTGHRAVYRYYYERPRTGMRSETGNAPGLAGGASKAADPQAPKAPRPIGASHSAEIEYAMGNLPSNRVFDWQAEDYQVSVVMQEYFANFVKTGNPNGIGLPEWPRAVVGKPAQVMHINVNCRAEPDRLQERYQWLDKQFNQGK